MTNNSHHVIDARYWEQKRALESQLKELEQSRYKELKELEARCLAEHGTHLDDGSMFFGMCVRCGAFLG